ncbi:hypothetical protein [Streptomyces yanii]|uniref:Uncharacterized protein n=1 Tax=Streptomyces yanii TaxID=78510 RepID=A0ABV5RDH9_9ACTN
MGVGAHLLLVVHEFHDLLASPFRGTDIAATRAAIEPHLEETDGRECGLTGTWRDAGV